MNLTTEQKAVEIAKLFYNLSQIKGPEKAEEIVRKNLNLTKKTFLGILLMTASAIID